MRSPEAFYLHIDGVQRGPYTVQHIDHLLHSGLIAEETTFWREGLEQWEPVTQLVPRRQPLVRRWGKWAVMAGCLVALAIVGRLVWPTLAMGWREVTQREYTETAAYWRARGFIREEVSNQAGVVVFSGENSAQVSLVPPAGAKTVVQGQLTPAKGATTPAAWALQMQWDAQSREWHLTSMSQMAATP